MDVEETIEVVVQAFSTYTEPQWAHYRRCYSGQEALDYVMKNPELMLRAMERTVITVKGEWTQVTQ